jgi:hypothetical protein
LESVDNFARVGGRQYLPITIWSQPTVLGLGGTLFMKKEGKRGKNEVLKRTGDPTIGHSVS